MRKAKRLALRRNMQLSLNPTDDVPLTVKPSKQGLSSEHRVRGKTKTKGSSKAPQGWYTAGQFGG
ncbi:hypothetical protein RCIP0106_00008 [Klebsiella phage RCIP0106]